MPKRTDMGIYLKNDKTFYYLEYGENYIGNTLDRVRKTLIQRNLIQGLTTSPREVQYELISYKDAEDQDISMTPIFISKHIQSLFEKAEGEASGGNFK